MNKRRALIFVLVIGFFLAAIGSVYASTVIGDDITTDGNVGIGVASPTEALEVDGNVNIGASGLTEPILSLSSLHEASRWNWVATNGDFFGNRDDVMFLGWNVSKVGTPLPDPTEPSISLGFESDYKATASGPYYMEGYFEFNSVGKTASRRPYQFTIDRDDYNNRNFLNGKLDISNSSGTLKAQMNEDGNWAYYANTVSFVPVSGDVTMGTNTNSTFTFIANGQSYMTMHPAAGGVRIHKPVLQFVAGAAATISTGDSNDLILARAGTQRLALGANGTYFPNGNVGFGNVSSPTQKIEVDGGVRYNTATAKPTCDSAVRGTTWFVQGAGGVKDTFEVCAKDAGDAYSWRTLY